MGSATTHARDVVRVSVLDGGAGFEAPRGPVAPPDGPGGWGLYLVEQLAVDWGVDNRNGTSRVWFEMPVPVREPMLASAHGH